MNIHPGDILYTTYNNGSLKLCNVKEMTSNRIPIGIVVSPSNKTDKNTYVISASSLNTKNNTDIQCNWATALDICSKYKNLKASSINWYLPNIKELYLLCRYRNEIYSSINNLSLPKIEENSYYWSSVEEDKIYAYCVDSYDSLYSEKEKNYPGYIRPFTII